MADADDASRRRASQATIMSLLQLDPAPIEDPTDDSAVLLPEDHEGAYGEDLDEDGSTIKSGSLAGSTTSSVGLSGSGWGGNALFYREHTQNERACYMA